MEVGRVLRALEAYSHRWQTWQALAISARITSGSLLPTFTRGESLTHQRRQVEWMTTYTVLRTSCTLRPLPWAKDCATVKVTCSMRSLDRKITAKGSPANRSLSSRVICKSDKMSCTTKIASCSQRWVTPRTCRDSNSLNLLRKGHQRTELSHWVMKSKHWRKVCAARAKLSSLKSTRLYKRNSKTYVIIKVPIKHLKRKGRRKSQLFKKDSMDWFQTSKE